MTHKPSELGALLLVLVAMAVAGVLYASPREQDEVDISQQCDLDH
jgi:hypothetical protein